MFDFIGKGRWFFLASSLIIIAGITSLIVSIWVPGGLELGIDFKEGTAVTVGPAEGATLTLEEVEGRLNQDDLSFIQSDMRIQVQDENGVDYFYIHTGELTDEEGETLKAALAGIGEVEEYGTVSAAVASDTVRNAAIAVGVASIAILLYITWSFRKMPSPFRYGTCAIIALIHDVMIVLSIFSIVGRILHWEIDPMFVTAVLAVIGYSVNDSIVVFDRLRENLPKGISRDLRTVVNYSVTETMGRSLNTSITTLLAVFTVYLFVGGSIQNFVMALLIGIASGTYSSIFIASYLLVIWEEGKWRRFVPPLPLLRRLRTSY